MADMYEALLDAITTARSEPDRAAEEIVADIASGVRIAEPKTVEVRQRAEEALFAAKQGADELGEHPDVATLDALIGIGYALLAMGQDAEVFFSLFANGSARVAMA